jgi:hypothetical protein
MRLDIRLPIGAMFVVLGALLAVFGLISDKAMYERSHGINVNLWWGLILLAVGAVTVWLGRRGTSAARSTDESVEGRRIEEREHRTGMERENRPRGH